MNYTIPVNLYTHIGKYSYSIKTIDECLTIFRKEKNSPKEEEVLNINSLLNPSEYFLFEIYIIREATIELVDVSSADNDILTVALDMNNMEDYKSIVYRISTKEEICHFNQCKDVCFSPNYPVLKLYYLKYHDRRLNNQLWQYNLNTKENILLYEEKDPEYVLTMRNSGKYIIVTSASKHSNEVRIIDEDNERKETKLILFKQRENNVKSVISNINNKWIIYTNQYNPNYQIYSSDDINEKKWKLLFELPDNQTMPNIVLNLYTKTHPEIKILSLKDNEKPYTINIDNQLTSIDCSPQNSEYPKIQIVASNPFTFPQYFDFNYETKELIRLKQYDKINEYEDKIKDICCETHYVKNKSIEIPITICRNKRLNKYNKSPILANVYGCYGLTLTTEYNPFYLYLLLHGWIIAFCHVRGGGGNGIKWENSGKLLNKMNSIYDYIECINYLSELPFVDNRNLFCYGSSAGGIVVGASMNMIENTQLIKGSLLFSPYLNIIDELSNKERSLSKHERGELGDINKKEIKEYIMKYDPYYNIKRKKYPNMFVVSGRNDYRISYDDVVKYVNRIKLMNKAKTKIYLRTLNSGHFGSTECYDEAIYFLSKMKE